MRALTLWQPWAFLVANGHKLVENRPWKPTGETLKIDDRFAIHAGKKFQVGEWNGLLEVCRERRIEVPEQKALDYGAILATARYAGVVTSAGGCAEAQRDWFSGPFGLILADVRLLAEPIPCKGMLGLWAVPGDLADAIHRMEMITRPASVGGVRERECTFSLHPHGGECTTRIS